MTITSRLADPAAPTVPLALLEARRALAQATRDYLAIPDERLDGGWQWRDRELDVRYGVYRAFESVEAATADLEAVLAGGPLSMAARRIGPATAARWALHGRLAALNEAILDRVAREGEWTVREVLGHVVDGQRSYGWFTRWWVSRPVGAPLPDGVPDDVEAASRAYLPGEEADAAGTLAEIRVRLDGVLDEWALRLAGLSDAELETPALWWGTRVDVGFRLSRWSSHIVEHTVQLDKTLDWLGHRPREVVRIVRALHAAWGRLEARVFPVLPGTAAPVLAELAERLVAEAASTRAAAKA